MIDGLELDDKLRAALDAEDEELFDELAELSMPQAVLDSFQQQSRGLVVLTFVSLTVCFVLAIVCGVMFVNAPSVPEMMRWGMGFLFFLLAVIAMKIWYWMELNKNAIRREMKRVELQLAALATRLDGGELPTDLD